MLVTVLFFKQKTYFVFWHVQKPLAYGSCILLSRNPNSSKQYPVKQRPMMANWFICDCFFFSLLFFALWLGLTNIYRYTHIPCFSGVGAGECIKNLPHTKGLYLCWARNLYHRMFTVLNIILFITWHTEPMQAGQNKQFWCVNRWKNLFIYLWNLKTFWHANWPGFPL